MHSSFFNMRNGLLVIAIFREIILRVSFLLRLSVVGQSFLKGASTCKKVTKAKKIDGMKMSPFYLKVAGPAFFPLFSLKKRAIMTHQDNIPTM